MQIFKKCTKILNTRCQQKTKGGFEKLLEQSMNCCPIWLIQFEYII